MYLKLVQNLNLHVSLGADNTAQAVGENKPLTMTLGPKCSHKNKYTVIEIGDHSIILG